MAMTKLSAERLAEIRQRWPKEAGKGAVANSATIDIDALYDHIAAVEAERDALARALRRAARNDATRYDHHQPRKFDGQRPTGGSIWLTPREIARRALNEPMLATPDDIEGLAESHKP